MLKLAEWGAKNSGTNTKPTSGAGKDIRTWATQAVKPGYQEQFIATPITPTPTPQGTTIGGITIPPLVTNGKALNPAAFDLGNNTANPSAQPTAAAMAQNQAINDRLYHGTDKLTWKDKVRDIAQNPAQLVPFLSSGQDVKQLADLLGAANRLKTGKATDEDAVMLKDYIDQQNRDKSFGYKVMEVVSMMPSFAGELYLTGGASELGKAGATKGLKYLFTKTGKQELPSY